MVRTGERRGSGTARTYKTYGTYGMSRRDCGSCSGTRDRSPTSLHRPKLRELRRTSHSLTRGPWAKGWDLSAGELEEKHWHPGLD
jgi:hypothetical protein